MMNGSDCGFDRYLPLRQKMERQILYRREREQRQETWENNSKYFATWAARVAKHNAWTSGKFFEDGYNYSEMPHRHQRELEIRRSKLKALLDEENASYDKELREIDSRYQSILKNGSRNKSTIDANEKLEVLRRHAEELRKKKEEEREKEVAAKEFLRWRANNPSIREVDSRMHAQFVRKAWEDQRHEKEERDRLAKESNSRIEEEMRIYREKEMERLETDKAYKDQQLQKWKDEIRKQREELKLREEMAIKLDEQLGEIEKQQALLTETIQARERLALDREKKKALVKFWDKQTRMKIRSVINDRIQSISDDNKMLEYLKLLEDKRSESRISSTQSVIASKIAVARQHLEELRRSELQREKEAAALFEEEAKKFLRQQEMIWEKERQMSEQLMQDVILTVRKQIEEKRRSNELQRERLNSERGQILYSIEERSKQIAEEEIKAREAIAERQSELTQQIYEKRKQKEQDMLDSLDSLSKIKFLEDKNKNQEIAEIKKMELNAYQPKYHGYRKLAW